MDSASHLLAQAIPPPQQSPPRPHLNSSPSAQTVSQDDNSATSPQPSFLHPPLSPINTNVPSDSLSQGTSISLLNCTSHESPTKTSLLARTSPPTTSLPLTSPPVSPSPVSLCAPPEYLSPQSITVFHPAVVPSPHSTAVSPPPRSVSPPTTSPSPPPSPSPPADSPAPSTISEPILSCEPVISSSPQNPETSPFLQHPPVSPSPPPSSPSPTRVSPSSPPPSPPVSASLLGLSFADEELDLQRHSNGFADSTTSKSRQFPCTICGKQFRFISILALHASTHRVRGPLAQGRGVSKTLLQPNSQRPSLLGHQRQRETSSPVNRDHMSEDINETVPFLPIPPPPPLPPPRHHCPFCKGKFRKAAELERHLRILHRPYKCHLCDFAASQEGELVGHVERRHAIPQRPKIPPPMPTPIPTPPTPPAEFKCEVCSQSFTQSWFLKGHMRKHKDSFDHRCSVCGRCFKESWFLKNHMKVHLGKIKTVSGPETPGHQPGQSSHATSSNSQSSTSSRLLGYQSFYSGLLLRLPPPGDATCSQMLQATARAVQGGEGDNEAAGVAGRVQSVGSAIGEGTTTKIMLSQGSSGIVLKSVGYPGERPYKCPHCSYAGTQSGSLKYHLQRHHRDSKLSAGAPLRGKTIPPSASQQERLLPSVSTAWGNSCADMPPPCEDGATLPLRLHLTDSQGPSAFPRVIGRGVQRRRSPSHQPANGRPDHEPLDLSQGNPFHRCMYCPFVTSVGELMSLHLQVHHGRRSRRKGGYIRGRPRPVLSPQAQGPSLRDSPGQCETTD
uniref:C2H2-type domain-containing protein n=1 Tax=Leptobrachium leishanense TaxID=445787 RepID=A0A8C5PYD6_9ANUR